MNNKKKAVLVGLCLIVIALLAACYFHQQNKKEIVLELGVFTGSNWNVANANSFTLLDRAIEKFEAENSGVRVHYYSGVMRGDYSEWLSRKILEGKVPDVFMILDTDFNKFCSMGIVKNLNELIKEDDSFRPDVYFTSSYETGKYRGAQYALPYETVPTLMFVNKSLLNAEGITVPKENWTWGELYEICNKVTKDTNNDGSLDQFGIYNYDWKDAAFSNGGMIFSEDGEESYLTDPNVINAIKFVGKLEQINHGQTITQEDFNGGNVAFMPLTYAEYRTYKTYPYRIKKYANMTWDCITMPAGPEGDNLSEVNTLLIGISEKTKKEALAWEFLKLLTSDEDIQKQIFKHSQGASVLKSVTGSKEAEEMMQAEMAKEDKVINSELLSQVIEQGHVEPKFQKYEQAISLADSEIMKILENNKTLDSSMKILQRTINSYLQQ